MSSRTETLNLIKPSQSELYDVDIFNDNMDKVDTFAKENTVVISSTPVEGGISAFSTGGAYELLEEFNNSINSINSNLGDVSALDTTAKTVVPAINELKNSVSDGKTLVANAITEKGVATESTDSFATMAENISNIESGGGVISIIYDITEDMWDIYYPNNFIESHIVNINPININASEVIG